MRHPFSAYRTYIFSQAIRRLMNCLSCSADIGHKEEGAFAAMIAASITIHICVTKMYVITGNEGMDANGATHATKYMTTSFGPAMFVIVGREAYVRTFAVPGFMKPPTQHGAHPVNVAHLRDPVQGHFLVLKSQQVTWINRSQQVTPINLAVLGLHRLQKGCQE